MSTYPSPSREHAAIRHPSYKETSNVHILGAVDPGRRGALALFNLCNNGTTSLCEHKHGHKIPKVAVTPKSTAALISGMLILVEKRGQSGR